MKRTRSDSPTMAVQAAMSAGIKIEPPKHCRLRAGDMPFWESIVAARAKSTWTVVDLETAANLARAKADIERLQVEIDSEGDVIENQRGTPIMNPKHALLETLTRRAVALSRMLHVHAEATLGKSEKAAPALRAEQEAEKDLDSADELIPRMYAVA